MRREPLFTAPFVLCALANGAQGLGFHLFLHFPGYLRDLGAREAEIGLIFAVASVAAIGLRPPLGRTMDRRGRRPLILWGGVANSLVCAAYLTVTELGPWVYAVRIAHGFSEAVLFTTLFTYAADWVPAARRTQGLALFGVSGMLPIALGGALGDAILARADYAALFATATGFAVLSLLLSLPLRDRPLAEPHAEPARGFRAALAQPDLLPLWWLGGVFATALASVFAFLKLYVEDTGLGTVGAFFGAYAASAITERVLLGWLPDRVGPKRVLFPALLALAGGFAALALADSALDVALAGALCGVGHGYTFPILFGLVVTRARSAERGSAMAIYTALFDLGMLAGGPTLGFVIEAAGYGALFSVAAGAIVAGAAVFAVWDRGR